MTKEELIKKAAFEAYPKNESYSTLVERVVDYNNHYRWPYQAGLEKGWQMAVEKATEWLKSWDAYRVCVEGRKDWFIEQFQRAMEE